MTFFDAHCDTVLAVLGGGLDFHMSCGREQMSLPAMVDAGLRTQVFACFILRRACPGMERAAAIEAIRTVHMLARQSEGRMAVALDSASLKASFTGGPVAALIALEGADPLEGDAEAIRTFHQMGVRSLIPAWEDNEFSGTAFGRNTSLTPEGEKLIGLCEELRIAIDVSHLSDLAFARTLEITRSPVIASHSNARAICPSNRNLTDPMIRQLAERGGVLGINLSSDFLDPLFLERERALWDEHMGSSPGSAEDESRYDDAVAALPRPDEEWIVRHVVHAIQVGGEDCVGLGGDLDGVVSVPQGFRGVRDYPRIPRLLREAGLSDRQVEKVCYRNLHRVFCEILPKHSDALTISDAHDSRGPESRQEIDWQAIYGKGLV